MSTLRLATQDWRQQFLRASVALAAMLVVITETLSALGALSGFWIATAWATVSVTLIALIALIARRGGLRRRGRVKLSLTELAALLGLASVFVLVAAAGIKSDPNNWDSLTYHLPRVAQWLQAGDVGHFATANIRQLDQPPLSSYAIAHLVAVTGTDRVAFLVQWAALAGCCVLASRVVAQLSGDRKAQVAAAVVCGTAPMAVLQGSSTQNDLVMAFWFLAACSVALESRTSSPRRVLPTLAVIVALALLTKGTALALIPTPVLFALWSYRSAWRVAVPAAARGALVASVLITPHYARNIATFGNVVAPETAAIQSVDDRGRVQPVIATAAS